MSLSGTILKVTVMIPPRMQPAPIAKAFEVTTLRGGKIQHEGCRDHILVRSGGLLPDITTMVLLFNRTRTTMSFWISYFRAVHKDLAAQPKHPGPDSAFWCQTRQQTCLGRLKTLMV